jgi:hypothetical protein
MMKLSAIEKMDRKLFKDMMVAKNGQMFTDEDFSITVVAVPACGRTDSAFVHVAVAQCSSGDTFKRKRGELVALERWADGCVLSVRRNGRTLADVADDLVGFLTM